MGSQIPHAAIRAAEERTFTPRLLKEVADDGPDLAESIVTLGALADPRAAKPLLTILEERGRPERVREAAGTILRATTDATDPSDRHRWWRSGDRILQRHALLTMDRGDGDMLASVAAASDPAFMTDALIALTFGFDEPRFQRTKIDALAHAHPEVRVAACNALHWDQPVAGEQPLLRCMRETDLRVARAALRTLQYYCSQSVLRALSEFCASAPIEIRQDVCSSFEAVRDTFREVLSRATGDGLKRLKDWMAPVLPFLSGGTESSAAPLEPTPSATAQTGPIVRSRPMLSAQALIELITDLDGAWAEKKTTFIGIDWHQYAEIERTHLGPVLRNHADPWIREQSARAFVAWDDIDSLLALVDDASFSVRKSAVYACGRLKTRSARAAERAWKCLNESRTSSTHASEALHTYVRHERAETAVPRLVALVRNDPRQSVRLQAVTELVAFDAADSIRSIASTLFEPPGVTWAVHTAILNASFAVGAPLPDTKKLVDVDDLFLQEALLKM